MNEVTSNRITNLNGFDLVFLSEPDNNKYLAYFKDSEDEQLCKSAFNEQINFDWNIIGPIPDAEWEKMREE